MKPVLRDNGLSDLVDGTLDTIATGFNFTEGPLWLPEGCLIFQDLRASRTHRWWPDGRCEVLREHTGGANGQTIDQDGWIVFAEQDGRRVSRMRPDGAAVETLAERFEGKRLNSPNDLVMHPDGTLFFTDPAYGVPTPAEKELDFQGVFAFEPPSKRLSLVSSQGFEKPNGLAFSNDGNTLYVNDTGKYHTRALVFASAEAKAPATPPRAVASDTVIGTYDPEEPGGPDGIKVDQDGRLYVAVAQGIWVLDPKGTLLGIIATPKRPSNLAWGDPDSKTLYITAVDLVLRQRMRVAGQRPAFFDEARA